MCITKIMSRFWWSLAFLSILMLFVWCGGSAYSNNSGASESNGRGNYNNINLASESLPFDANQSASNGSDDNKVNLVSESLPFDANQSVSNSSDDKNEVDHVSEILTLDAAQIVTGFIGGTFENLLSQNNFVLSRYELSPSCFINENGSNLIRLEEGMYKIHYGSQDISPVSGTPDSHTSGYQLIGFMDQDANLTDDMYEVDFIGIEDHDLSYTFWQGDVEYIVVVNGKLLFGGFYNGADHVMSGTDFNIKGHTSKGDTFNLTIPDPNVSFDPESYPYPEAGQSEKGTLVYDDKAYNFVIFYDGTRNATIQDSVASSASFNIDLYNGSNF